MPSGTFYLYWDCPSCGRKKIRGDNKSCPDCHKARSVQCYEVEGEPDIVDPQELAAAHIGPDWKCSYCDAVNAADMEVCHECGSPRKSGKQHKVITYPSGVTPTATDLSQEVEDRIVSDEGDNTHYAGLSYPHRNEPVKSLEPEWFVQEHPRDLQRKKLSVAGVLAIAFGVIAIVGYLILRPYKAEVTVDEFQWTRTVSIEKYAWVSESSLTGFPSGSRNQNQNWEVVGHHQEVSGSHTEYDRQCHSEQSGESCTTTDLGNGRADRSCSPNYTSVCESVPRQVIDYESVADYGYRYYYEIQRWIHSRTPKSEGKDHKPYWPEFTLAVSGDIEQEVSRSEKYVILYIDDEQKSYVRDVPYSEWSDYDADSHYLLELNGLGTILSIEKVSPQ